MKPSPEAVRNALREFIRQWPDIHPSIRMMESCLIIAYATDFKEKDNDGLLRMGISNEPGERKLLAADGSDC